MLIRIVKLTIKKEYLSLFFEEFNKKKYNIIEFPGCLGMRLLKDLNNKNTIMTYSHWDDENALNNYRNSKVFKELWGKIKPYFDDKPEAWSHEIYFNGMNPK